MKDCNTGTYSARPSATPPHATNCLLERIGGMSEQEGAVAKVLFLMISTSPFTTTSYCGPDGNTRISKML